MDAGRFAAVLGALWAAHDLADHVVQTDHQAATKASDWWGMAGHVGGYGATQAVALAALHGAGVRLRPSRVLVGLAVSLVTHGFLDRRWPVVRLLAGTGSIRFATPLVRVTPSYNTPDDVAYVGGLPIHGPYLADQALHHVCVALAAALIAGGR